MTTPSLRDVERLSTFLDGQLTRAEMTRLEVRLKNEPALGAVLLDLRQARQLLRLTPRRTVPRNFTLTPKMAGIRPPVPRLVPALSWASVMAMLVFIFTLGGSLLGELSFGAASPLKAAAPQSASGVGGGYGYGGGPAETQPPAADNLLTTPTPQALLMTAPEATTPEETLGAAPPAVPAVQAPPEPVNFWPFIWLGLAALLIASALLIRLINIQTFRRKVGGSHKP
jgi:hypothetical protein